MKRLLIAGITFLFLASCGGTNSDIINPDAEVLYFYGATCPHCQELNRKLKDNGGIEQYSVEKREVYYNSENNALFLQTAQELGIEEWKVGVPFAYNKTTGEYVVGTQPAFDLITWSSTNTPVETGTGDVTEG